MPITDYNDVLLAAEEAKARAAMLRKQTSQPRGQMVGGFYVAPSWAEQLSPVVNQVLAGYEDYKGREGASQGRQGMEKAAQEWMQNRPQPTSQTTELPGPQQEFEQGPLTGTTVTPPTQQQNLDWAQQGTTNPLTKALAAEYGKDILVKEPERQENREYRSHEAQLARDATMERFVMDLRQRAEAAKLRSEDTRLGIDARADATREAQALRMQIAQMTNSLGRDRLAQDAELARMRDATTRYGIDERTKANRTKMGAKATSELDEADSLVNGIDLALEKLTTVKDSSLGAYTRGLVTEKLPGGETIASGLRGNHDNASRQTAFDIVSGIKHGRYGTALSQTENAQAAMFLPTAYDDSTRVMEKLRGLRELMTLSHRRLRLMESSGLTLEEAMRTYPQATAPKAGAGDLSPEEAAELARRKAAAGSAQ